MKAEEWALERLLDRLGKDKATFERDMGKKISELSFTEQHSLIRQFSKQLKTQDRRAAREANKHQSK